MKDVLQPTSVVFVWLENGKCMFCCWRGGMKRCGRHLRVHSLVLFCFRTVHVGGSHICKCFLQSMDGWSSSWMISCCLGEGQIKTHPGRQLLLRWPGEWEVQCLVSLPVSLLFSSGDLQPTATPTVTLRTWLKFLIQEPKSLWVSFIRRGASDSSIS